MDVTCESLDRNLVKSQINWKILIARFIKRRIGLFQFEANIEAKMRFRIQTKTTVNALCWPLFVADDLKVPAFNVP